VPQSGPSLRLRSGWPPSSFPQFTCLDRLGGRYCRLFSPADRGPGRPL